VSLSGPTCAASTLLAGLLDRSARPLTEVARTRMSVHYETGSPQAPVLSVVTPSAVRLPASLVVTTLPAPGAASLGRGRLVVGGTTWRVTRWWRPARPQGLRAPADDRHTELAALLPDTSEEGVPLPSYGGLAPATLVGRGPGLTPAGDDVLAGALVAAHATSDPRLPRWQQETRAALGAATTTAVSRALLHHALDGYATDELADVVTAVCTGVGVTAARERVLRLGHTSGAALLHGVLHVLTTPPLEGAA
jgi:hypothetical protein